MDKVLAHTNAPMPSTAKWENNIRAYRLVFPVAGKPSETTLKGFYKCCYVLHDVDGIQ